MKGKKEILEHITALEKIVIKMDIKQDDRFTLIGGLAVVKNLVERAKWLNIGHIIAEKKGVLLLMNLTVLIVTSHIQKILWHISVIKIDSKVTMLTLY